MYLRSLKDVKEDRFKANYQERIKKQYDDAAAVTSTTKMLEEQEAQLMMRLQNTIKAERVASKNLDKATS